MRIAAFIVRFMPRTAHAVNARLCESRIASICAELDAIHKSLLQAAEIAPEKVTKPVATRAKPAKKRKSRAKMAKAGK